MTAVEVRKKVARKLKDATIRTVLRRLEEKGYVTHTVDAGTFVYPSGGVCGQRRGRCREGHSRPVLRRLHRARVAGAGRCRADRAETARGHRGPAQAPYALTRASGDDGDTPDRACHESRADPERRDGSPCPTQSMVASRAGRCPRNLRVRRSVRHFVAWYWQPCAFSQVVRGSTLRMPKAQLHRRHRVNKASSTISSRFARAVEPRETVYIDADRRRAYRPGARRSRVIVCNAGRR